MILEVACFNLQDALLAAKNGADRIEFCEDYSAGGITPGEEEIIKAREQIRKPLFVMIRPRSGNFRYSPAEFDKMKQQIDFCRKQDCKGLVFGILDEKNRVDTEKCRQLVELAGSMECTFHRAFDETPDLQEALNQVISCGFSRILSSGGKGAAANNLLKIKELNTLAAGRILVMPGGGVRSANISEIIRVSGAKEIHTAAINPKNLELDTNEILSMKEKIAAPARE